LEIGNETNIKESGSILNHRGNPFKMFAGAVAQTRKYILATTLALLKSDPPTADIQLEGEIWQTSASVISY
jgi:hypothetical protein